MKTDRQIEFLRLSEKRVLLIVVTPDGDVLNRILLTERDYSPSELVSAANYINQNYSGQSFEDATKWQAWFNDNKNKPWSKEKSG